MAILARIVFSQYLGFVCAQSGMIDMDTLSLALDRQMLIPRSEAAMDRKTEIHRLAMARGAGDPTKVCFRPAC